MRDYLLEQVIINIQVYYPTAYYTCYPRDQCLIEHAFKFAGLIYQCT